MPAGVRCPLPATKLVPRHLIKSLCPCTEDSFSCTGALHGDTRFFSAQDLG